MSIWGSVATFLFSETAAGLIPEPIKIVFGCLFCFDNNIQTLEKVAEKLERERDSLQTRVDNQVNNAQIVDRKVKDWLEETDKNQRKMTEILSEIRPDENAGVSSRSRFWVTKKVKETIEAMEQLLQSCEFDVIANPPPPEASVPPPHESTFEFESRKNIEEGIMSSLGDDEVFMVGIYGMGGVGKTTLAKRIWDRISQNDENRLFEEIVMVVVGRNADMVRIQKDIARSLALELDEKSSNAYQLRTRLSNSTKRRLIIIDDVWDYLNLVDLGITCSSHCKVLLTSRNTDVFKKMNVEEVHRVNLLTESEAWHFFQLNAGNSAAHPNVVSVAQQVVEECKGLPIALETVGRSLKGTENRYIWEDSLQQLRSSNPSDMPDVLKEVYRPLRWSYDALPSERGKFLFLMCCLYPEDFDIPIEELAINAIGLGILDGIKLKQIRNRVYSLVEILKSRSLLLEGYPKNHVKMHDVVRDVAAFIASAEKLIPAHSKSNDCTWISPCIRETLGLNGGPAGYLNLRLLWIDCYSRDKELEIHDHTFEGMKELHVLSIKRSPMRQLSISMMENLQTLVLEFCKSLESITVVGELLNLKISHMSLVWLN